MLTVQAALISERQCGILSGANKDGKREKYALYCEEYFFITKRLPLTLSTPKGGRFSAVNITEGSARALKYYEQH